jgi:hypothetical protein
MFCRRLAALILKRKNRRNNLESDGFLNPSQRQFSPNYVSLTALSFENKVLPASIVSGLANNIMKKLSGEETLSVTA